MQRNDLVESIQKRKDELGWTIERISQESGVGIRTVNRILAGQDVRFSSIRSVVEALSLTIHIEKVN